jgi:hypothetical protein
MTCRRSKSSNPIGLHSSGTGEDEHWSPISPSKGNGGGGVARKNAESTLERLRLGATHDQSAARDGQEQRGAKAACRVRVVQVPIWDGALPTRAIAFAT